MLTTLLRHYLLTKYRCFGSRDKLDKWHDVRVRRHLAWVMRHSPFYRELYRGLSPHDWRSYPIIDKQQMMDHFDALNTCHISRDEAFQIALDAEEGRRGSSAIGQVTIGLSSGTSGNRGLFLVSRAERYSWAGALLAKVLPAGLLTPQRIAFFFRTTSSLYSTVRSRHIGLEYYDLQWPIDEHIARLLCQQPTIVAAPPSMLRRIAEQMARGGLAIQPAKVISVAEVLDPLDEAYIASAFGQPVHQIYQATEGFLATTCAHGTLHLNEDLLVIQREHIAGAPRKFYPIITDFNRTSQPIIRYRLNDLLQLRAEPCPCGSLCTAIDFIEGRSDDILYFYNEAGSLQAIFPDYLRRAVIAADPHIEQYLIAQQRPGALTVALQACGAQLSALQRAVADSLDRVLRQQQVIPPPITFIPYEHCQPTKKLRRVQRQYSLSP